MRRLLPSISVMLVFCISGFAAGRPDDRDTEAYAVYSSLLNQISRGPEAGVAVKLFVINTHTSRDVQTDWRPQYVFQMYKYNLSEDFQAALADYEAINRQPEQLRRSFNLTRDYVFLDWNRFHAFFKDDNVLANWNAFYERYPSSPGYITVSRVGFDSNRTHALLYFQIECGGLCADGSYRLLTKKDEKWQLTKVISYLDFIIPGISGQIVRPQPR